MTSLASGTVPPLQLELYYCSFRNNFISFRNISTGFRRNFTTFRNSSLGIASQAFMDCSSSFRNPTICRKELTLL
jgi:hypothetical protein